MEHSLIDELRKSQPVLNGLGGTVINLGLRRAELVTLPTAAHFHSHLRFRSKSCCILAASSGEFVSHQTHQTVLDKVEYITCGRRGGGPALVVVT